MQKHDLGGWWLEAGVSSPCGIPGPDSAAAGAPRPAGAHTATQICRAGAEWSLQLQSVCSHCSHQSHAADAGFLQRGFYDPAALQRGGWAAVSGLHAAADCSNTKLSQLQHSRHLGQFNHHFIIET